MFNASNKEQYRKWVIEIFGELELRQKEPPRV